MRGPALLFFLVLGALSTTAHADSIKANRPASISDHSAEWNKVQANFGVMKIMYLGGGKFDTPRLIQKHQRQMPARQEENHYEQP